MNFTARPLTRYALLAAASLLLSGCPQPATQTATPSRKPAAKPASASPPEAAAIARSVRDFNRGAALLEQYRYADAVAAFEAAVAAQPTWSAARFNLALALLNQSGSPESLERAEKELLRIVRDEPGHRWAHFGLGVYNQHIGENEKALEHYEQVHRADPDDPFAAYKYAEVLIRLGRTDDAIRVLEAVTERDHGFVSAFYRLGSLYNLTKQREKAITTLRRFRDLNTQELAVGSYGVRDPYAAMGKYYTALGPDGLPVPPAAMTPAPRIVFGPEVRHFGEALTSWDWGSGQVALPGVASADLDRDGDLDLVLCGQGPDGKAQLYLNDGKARFTPGATVADHATSPVLGDVDNDGDLDLWLGRGADNDLLLLANEKGQFEPAPALPGTAAPHLTTCARLVDLDSDGDLDLLSSRLAAGSLPPGTTPSKPAPSVVLNNNLDDTFEDQAAKLGLAFPDTPIAALLADDFDNDRDLDLLVCPSSSLPKGQSGATGGSSTSAPPPGGPDDLSSGSRSDKRPTQASGHPLQAREPGAGPIAWENFRVGQYRTHDPAATGLNIPASLSATSGDPFKTGRRDVLLSSGDRLSLFRNRGPWKFERDETFESRCGSTGGTGAQFVDIDNDGDLDILVPDAHRRPPARRGPALLFNDWPEPRFTPAADRDPGLLLNTLECDGPAAAVAADFNGDGTCDLLWLAPGQPPTLLENLTRGGHWLALDLEGKRPQDQTGRSPNSPIGARVEFRGGTVTQQHVVGTPAGATAMPPLRLHAGLGDQPEVQWLRILWPDSILQAELELKADQLLTVSEISRRTTSCPHLFAWDGRQFAFVSDFGGVGGLGYLVAPGTYAPPDPTEVVPLPALVPRDGDFILQVVEPLEEIVYFDAARLLVVDHPPGTTVVPNEMAAVSLPPPEPRLFCFDRTLEPVRATDHRGVVVTDALRRTDRLYAGATAPDRRFMGYAADHHVDLDFGDALSTLPPGAHPVLLLDGWVEYSTSTSNYAASQAGLRLRAPTISVERDGRWLDLATEAGYPAGINHVMTLDLAGKLRPGDRRLRVATNMDISWDRIALGLDRGPADLVVRPISPRSADLHVLGYPREYSPDGRKPNLLDYSNIDRTETWLRMPGAYTRHGDVTDLVQSADDRFVILPSGDEITLRFPAAGLEPPRPGWCRTFLLDTDSYCKDMDLYTGAGTQVDPLPYHAMPTYPYAPATRSPLPPELRSYLDTYNTRLIAP